MRQVVGACLIAAACSATALPAAAQAAREGQIRVVGRADMQVVPDFASVSVGITNKAPTPTEAMDRNSQIAAKIIAFAKSFGIAAQDIRTASINLSPAFRSVRDPNGGTRQEPDGYSATNSVRVKLTDIGRLGAFMRQVLEQGATNIGGVGFGLSNPAELADEVRRQAVTDALRQAQLLADAAKVKLGAVRSIDYPPRAESSPSPGGVADMPMRVRGTAQAIPVEAGTIEISASVDVTIALE